MKHNNIIYSLISKKISSLHLPLIALIAVTCSYGLLVLYSAAGANIHPWVYKQLIHIIVCVPLLVLIAFLDIRTIYRMAWILYIVILLMLIGVDILGYTAKGGTRWIEIAGMRIQPSEPMKLVIVIMLARYFHGINERDVDRMQYLIIPIIATLLPAAIIMKQPDLGTGGIILIIASFIFFAAGVSIKKFLVVFAGLCTSMPILWAFLREYQKKRILVFLNPELDPLGSGYNIVQSKISIGSGGLFGKGIGSGPQSQLHFLPEHQTDFIFASLSEDFGFLGGIILLILYSLIIYISIGIAINAKSIFGKLLAIGVISMFFSHIFINIGMVMGLVPVVGVPLPLISYGGTMMGSMLGGFALIMNVHLNQSVIIGQKY